MFNTNEKQKTEDKSAGPDASMIKPEMKVVCPNDDSFAIVDHMEGVSTIKLNKDEAGVHHYIPLAWVTHVDDEVHIDRARDRAMREWTDTPSKT